MINSNETSFISTSNTAQIADINMADHFEYSTPDELPEWDWIEANALYSCRGNGESGVWDFFINTNLEYDDIPPALEPLFAEAKNKKISYILFNQGC